MSAGGKLDFDSISWADDQADIHSRAAEALDRGSQESFAEGPLQLDLFERQGSLRGTTATVCGESLLHHLGGVPRWGSGQADEDHQHAKTGDQCK